MAEYDELRRNLGELVCLGERVVSGQATEADRWRRAILQQSVSGNPAGLLDLLGERDALRAALAGLVGAVDEAATGWVEVKPLRAALDSARAALGGPTDG